MFAAAARTDTAIEAPWYRWAILFVCWLTFLLSFVDRLVWGNVAVSVGATLDLPLAALGVFVTAFYLGYIVFNILGGLALAQRPPPNIVFFLADDLGYADIGCYGRRDIRTPNIDRIAAEGVRFVQGYANSAVCSATRTALMTGRHQYRLPVGLEEPLSASSANVGLPPDHPTLPSLLKATGYGTMLLGKWHLGSLPSTARCAAATIISGGFAADRSTTTRTKAPPTWMTCGTAICRSTRPAT